MQVELFNTRQTTLSRQAPITAFVLTQSICIRERGLLIEIHIRMVHLRMHLRGLLGCTYSQCRHVRAVAQIEDVEDMQ